MGPSTVTPRRRHVVLATYYATYFATLGLWLPYWPLYLADIGHNAEAIGLLTALALGLKVLAPLIWGALADRGARDLALRGTSFAAFASALLFFWGTEFYFLLIATALYGFFHAAPLPLVDTLTMELSERSDMEYGPVRLWGSIGFILLSLGLGPFVDRWGLLLLAPAVLAFLLLINAVSTLFLPSTSHAISHAPSPSTTRFSPFFLLAEKRTRWFYLSAFLMQFSHGAYYGFFSIHLENHGFSNLAIGALWALGVLSEIVLMHFSGRLITRWGVSSLLTGSLLLAALRWFLYAGTIAWPLLIVAQLLHAFTFAAFHVAAVRRTFDLAPATGRITAQGWYGSLSFGLGGSAGMILSGQLFNPLGAEGLFAIMGLTALIGAAVSYHAALTDSVSVPIRHRQRHTQKRDNAHS